VTVQPPPETVGRYPPGRFMGSKERLLPTLGTVFADLPDGPALDLFSGSGIVSHLLKRQGRAVLANDQMAMCATFTRAMVENDAAVLEPAAVERLLTETAAPDDGFVWRTFGDLYYAPEDVRLIDRLRANLKAVEDDALRAVGMTALIRACLKKRPRGVFTYTGRRYDDGRRDLRLPLADHVREQAALVNGAVFPGTAPVPSRSRWGDAMDAALAAMAPAVVYLDPPYFSPLSDNDYVRRYHFLEGLARDWRGLTLQAHTRTRKFARYPTPFATAAGAAAAFDTLFARFRDSALVVSYASNAQPDRATLKALLGRYKRRVEVIDIDHRYSFGTQRPGQRNAITEYLFIGA
jgi:DNA adenine methylase